MKHLIYISLFLFSFINSTFAINELNVRVANTTRKGYISRATLTVEPHGSYAEQSLYISYTDNWAFSGRRDIEIVHKFELPDGAVVNDMWLWIGDSVMKAKVYDIWTARHIYDSIVRWNLDPAIFTKRGNQYELRVFPLTSGSFRKVKINYITPVSWYGRTARIELPVKLLKANNNLQKPLQILFRSEANSTYNPVFLSDSPKTFRPLVDTAGYSYHSLNLDNISNYDSLIIQHTLYSVKGAYYNSGKGLDSLNYFQLSLELKDVFSLDSISNRILIGVDLSSAYNKNKEILIPAIKELLWRNLNPVDTFNIVITGAGETKYLFNNWQKYSDRIADSILNDFSNSELANKIFQYSKLKIGFSDSLTASILKFNHIDELALVNTFTSTSNSIKNIKDLNVIASYTKDFLDESEKSLIIASLDTFFTNGGVLIKNYDPANIGNSLLSHYVPGIKIDLTNMKPPFIYRNNGGNVAASFPESMSFNGTFTNFTHTDPTLKIEVRDQYGNPVIYSKKINNGLLLVSCLSNYTDVIKPVIGVPLLQLNSKRTASELFNLLSSIKTENEKNPIYKCYILSNSDSTVGVDESNLWVANYINGFNGNYPVYNSINLLDEKVISMPYVSQGLIRYPGSGYLLNELSSKSSGYYFETKTKTFTEISKALELVKSPVVKESKISILGDNDSLNIKDLREIIVKPVTIYSPKFFIGSTTAKNNLQVNVSAAFDNSTVFRTKTLSYPINNSSVKIGTIIPAMLGNEKIKEMFSKTPVDTSVVVKLAVKYNLLSNYTAFLALEPNDEFNFMDSFLDEDIIADVNENTQDSTEIISAYPNPFNAQTQIMLKLNQPSKVNISIYNILGQLVTRIAENEEVVGSKTYTWNGKEENNIVSSGIYFTRIETENIQSKVKNVKTIKLIMLK